MPGGALEVGETPAEGACREVWEETGIEVEPIGLAGVYDSRFWDARSRHHLYQFVFLCRPRDETQRPHVSDETLDVGWHSEREAATLSCDPNHGHRIGHAFRHWHGEVSEAIVDLPAGVDSRDRAP